MIIVLYVDDIYLAGKDDDITGDVSSLIKAKFEIFILEGTDLFLEMTIENFDEGFKLHTVCLPKDFCLHTACINGNRFRRHLLLVLI